MKHLFVLPALLGGVLSVAAQTVPQQAAAAVDPQVPVPPVPYQPLPQPVASQADNGFEDWKAANATVGRYRGHNGILKWERAQAKEPAAGQAATQEPAR